MTTQEIEVAEILKKFNDKLDESENELKTLKAELFKKWYSYLYGI